MRWLPVTVIVIAVVAVVAGAIVLSEGQRGSPAVDPEDVGGELVMYIDGTKVDVRWEDNPSVDALKALAKGGLTVSTNLFGGFEQVGSLGKSLPSDDRRLTSSPGDIFLYGSDSIVLFFGENSWSYTPLGKIMGLPDQTITDLLDRPTAKITFMIV